jgi:L-alanine-DL-glutamate epimerase-like enolase superfamily enzyme
MKVVRAEVVRNREPIPLPRPWLAAWREPSGEPLNALNYAFYRLYTDEGIVGVGPYSGASPALVGGVDPFRVGAFWETHLSGRRAGTSGKGAAGLEIALWDIVGKAAGLPLHKLWGARRDRLPVYAATSRLLSAGELVQEVLEIVATGFKAVKLRLHRPDPQDDLRVVEAVRKAAGDDLTLLVDCNQNNYSEGYQFWSRQTAIKMARALQELDVYLMEEPLPRRDVAGLSEIATEMDMYIAGGEHSTTVSDFREHLLQGAYDILQPDVMLGGNLGINGLRETAVLADHFGRQVIPHVTSSGGPFPLCLSATLQVMVTVANCPMVEYPYDPPILVPSTTQMLVKEPILVQKDGTVKVPDLAGLGIELDQERLDREAFVSEAWPQQ